MCVNYTDLNRAYPKDFYPPQNIDKLTDNFVGYKLLSFIDAYFEYNQMLDWMKTTFMTKQANFQYNIIPFRLKNASAIYQRMVNKIFQEEIWKTLEVYMDGMIIKFGQEEFHAQHL